MTVCTNCGHEGAYIGAWVVECPNKSCKFFTNQQLESFEASKPVTTVAVSTPAPVEAVLASDEVEDGYQPPSYIWSHYFHDFGDA